MRSPAALLFALVFALVLSTPSARVTASVGGAQSPDASGDEFLQACRPHVLERVNRDAVDLGVPGGIAEAELDPLPTRQRKGTRTEVAGGGRFRLGPDYEWQPMTWACRHDEKDGKIDKVSYRGDRRAALAGLPPEKAEALQRCGRAARSIVMEQASRRNWRSGMVTVEAGEAGVFDEVNGRPQVRSVGDVTVRTSMTSHVTMRYTCTFDGDGGLDAAVVLSGSHTSGGELVQNRYETLTCESDNYGERRCQAPRPIAGNVRLKRQMSKTSCNGRWRWDTWEIVVRDGCRAEFEFETR